MKKLNVISAMKELSLFASDNKEYEKKDSKHSNNNSNAYAVMAYDDDIANIFMYENIRRELKNGENVLVFCLDTVPALKAIKYSKFAKGLLTIIEVPFEQHIPSGVKELINENLSNSHYDAIYVLDYTYDELMAEYMEEYNDISGEINIPIFISIQNNGKICNIEKRLFTLTNMPEYNSSVNLIDIYSLSYSENAHKSILIYDLYSKSFKDLSQ